MVHTEKKTGGVIFVSTADTDIYLEYSKKKWNISKGALILELEVCVLALSLDTCIMSSTRLSWLLFLHFSDTSIKLERKMPL